MLTSENIKKHLGEKYNFLPVTVFESTDSTNTQAKLSSLPHGIFAARHQTDGRGRQGKSFFSPLDTGLYMSVILPITPIDAYEFSLTAAASVAAARAIQRLSGIYVQIKWVNDLYLDGKKIAGILTEAHNNRVIVGIGINLTTDIFPEDIPLAGSLNSKSLSPSALAAEFAKELFEITESRRRDFMEEYRCRSMLPGKDITFEKDGKSFCAKALYIEDNGGLTVLQGDTEITLNSGEVHILL